MVRKTLRSGRPTSAEADHRRTNIRTRLAIAAAGETASVTVRHTMPLTCRRAYRACRKRCTMAVCLTVYRLLRAASYRKNKRDDSANLRRVFTSRLMHIVQAPRVSRFLWPNASFGRAWRNRRQRAQLLIQTGYRNLRCHPRPK